MAVLTLTNPPVEAPVHPRDCALLVAIPLTRESFYQDLQSAAPKDFARTYREDVGGNDADAWEAYRSYAQLAADVIGEVSRLGTTVITNPNLAALHSAVARFPVTTLVAHWRSARFRPTDIIDLDRVSARVGLSSPAEADDLAARLNALLDVDAGPENGSSPHRAAMRTEITDRQYHWFRARQALECELPGAFLGGAGIELAEGFETIETVLSGIPADYAGVLDLTVCQSVLLGERIRQKCRDALVLMSANLTSLDFRFAFYHQTMDLLAARPQPYADAVVSIRKELIATYDKKKNPQRRPR